MCTGPSPRHSPWQLITPPLRSIHVYFSGLSRVVVFSKNNVTADSAQSLALPCGYSEAAHWWRSTWCHHGWLCRIQCDHCWPSTDHPQTESSQWWRALKSVWKWAFELVHGSYLVIWLCHSEKDRSRWLLIMLPVLFLSNMVSIFWSFFTECHFTGIVHLYL